MQLPKLIEVCEMDAIELDQLEKKLIEEGLFFPGESLAHASARYYCAGRDELACVIQQMKFRWDELYDANSKKIGESLGDRNDSPESLATQIDHFIADDCSRARDQISGMLRTLAKK